MSENGEKIEILEAELRVTKKIAMQNVREQANELTALRAERDALLEKVEILEAAAASHPIGPVVPTPTAGIEAGSPRRGPEAQDHKARGRAELTTRPAAWRDYWAGLADAIAAPFERKRL